MGGEREGERVGEVERVRKERDAELIKSEVAALIDIGCEYCIRTNVNEWRSWLHSEK